MEKESLAKTAVKKKPTVVKVFIRICIFLMAFSLIWVYVAYMFSPAPEEVVEEPENNPEVTEILPENIDAENPENTDAPILVTEDWELNEMDQQIEVQYENNETELIRLGDLSDSLQIEQ